MSFASKVLYTGDSVTTDFNVPMPYISQTHISVFVNEILQLSSMNYVWSGASTISFVSPPGTDDAIEIRRWTSPSALLVDYVDGSVLNATDLDTAYQHTFYLSQEYSDSFNEVINAMLVRVATAEGIEATEPDQVILELVASMVDSAAAANLQARITDIDLNAEAIITLSEGLQVQINTLAQGVSADVYIQDDEPVPGEGGVPNPILEGSRWYDSDDNNAPYIYISSEWISIEDPRIGSAAASIDVLQVDYNNIYSAIVEEQFVRSTETTGFAQQLNLIGVQNGDQSAFILDLDTAYVGPAESLADRFTNITAGWTDADVVAVGDAATYTDAEITTEQTARANADTAIASDVTSLDARVVTAESDIDGAEAEIIVNAAQIVTEAGVAASATSAVASDVTSLTARVGVNEDDVSTNAAQIITEAGVAASATGAVASNLTTLETEVDGNTSSVTTLGTSIDGIEAEYGVTLNVNGYVTGFKLINTGTGSDAFVILASKFAIVDASGDPDETEYVPFEISDGKINMRADVKISGDLLVTGTINGTALINGTIGSTQIGANSITTDHIGANTIVANNIQANAITAVKINVANLAAVSANLGTITAGTIELDGAGWIKGGQSAYNTGNGYFLGYEGGGYKFSIGDSSSYLTWDGTILTVKGDLVVGEYVASDDIILSATTERTQSGHIAGLITKKSFTVAKDGEVKVVFQKRVFTNTDVYQQATYAILLNETLKFTSSITNTSYDTVTYTMTGVTAGDQIHLQIKGGTTTPGEPVPFNAYIRNAYIKADVVIAAGGSVDLD